MKVVDVVEFSGMGLFVFSGDDVGNRDAEDLFLKLVKENSEGYVSEAEFLERGPKIVYFSG